MHYDNFFWENACIFGFAWVVNVSLDIFQEKMSDLMAGLKFGHGHLDVHLIITYSTFEDQLCHAEVMLERLKRVGSKMNTGKSLFFALEKKYIGYILTKDGIKSVHKAFKARYF